MLSLSASVLPAGVINQEEFSTWKSEVLTKLAEDLDFQLFIPGGRFSRSSNQSLPIKHRIKKIINNYYIMLTLFDYLVSNLLNNFPPSVQPRAPYVKIMSTWSQLPIGYRSDKKFIFHN